MNVGKSVTDFVHIVFGYSESGNLRGAFPDQKPTILCFDDDLGMGPVQNLDSKVGTSTRRKWFRELYKDSDSPGSFGLAKAEWITNFEILKKSKKPILIWAGKSVKHQIWLRRILSHLPSNLKKFTTKSEGYYDVGTVQKMFSRKKAIPAKSKIRSKKEWIALQKNPNILRRFNSKGKIISVGADYFDPKILATKDFTKHPNKYIPAALIIGDIIGDFDFDCSINYLMWRLQELAKMGILKSVQKKPLQLKNWKVKLA